MSRVPPTALVWFGVLGGGIAWLVQFVANLAFTFAQCNSPGGRWQLPVHTWEIAISIPAILVAVSAEAVCVRLLRISSIGDVNENERRGKGSRPPVGRVNFLAQTGLLVNFLAAAIIVMTMIGAPLLQVCQQS